MSDTLGQHLNRIGRIPLLRPDEELALGAAVQRWLSHPDPCPPGIERRGRRARDRMVTGNLRLVVHAARRYHSMRGLDLDELIQAGSLGLIRAVEKFDPTRGYKLSTYAYWWIRQKITRYLQSAGHTVSMPGTDADRLARLSPVTSRLRVQLGREPIMQEIAEELRMKPEHLTDLLVVNRRCLSLDAHVPGHEATNLSDLIPALSGNIDAIEQAAAEALLAPLLAALAPDSRRVVEALYGLRSAPMTPSEIARAEGITINAARSKIRDAVERLRAESSRRVCRA